MNKTDSLPPALSTQLHHTAQAVQLVRQGRSLTDALARCPAGLRPGVQSLSFAVLRRLAGAQAARQALAPRPPRAEVEALLLCALALLWPGEGADAASYEDHTLVNQTVTAIKKIDARSAPFANAVLRRFVRERESLVPHLGADQVVHTGHPAWWIDRLRQDWPEAWEHIVRANNQQAPMVLRVNARWGSASDYVGKLAAAGLKGSTLNHPHLAQAVLLDRAVPVQRLPGFAEGQVSVQDLAAQWAAPLLLELLGARSPRPRVLDACAAPGGKTAHLLELAKLDLWALDRDPERLEKVNETLARLHLKAHTLAADASDPHAWWDGQCFDAILLDAPCSASGIVRRHPDIRWLRRPEDIRALQKTQRELLHQLWPLLKPEGLLLYATCSVFKAEGQDVIHDFLSHTPEAQPCHPALGHLLPGLPDTQHQLSSPGDGFFYSLLRKIP